MEGSRCGHCGTAFRAGRWQGERLIAQSAHSRVYLARDEQGQVAALKELHFALVPSAQELDAFEHEAKTLAERIARGPLAEPEDGPGQALTPGDEHCTGERGGACLGAERLQCRLAAPTKHSRLMLPGRRPGRVFERDTFGVRPRANAQPTMWEGAVSALELARPL